MQRIKFKEERINGRDNARYSKGLKRSWRDGKRGFGYAIGGHIRS